MRSHHPSRPHSHITHVSGFAGRRSEQRPPDDCATAGSKPQSPLVGAPNLSHANFAGRALSRRENDCLRHLEAGLSTAETAAALGLSRSTLNAHLASARQKLGVRSTTQALLLLIKQRTSDGITRVDVSSGPCLLNERQSALMDALSRCECFVDAWLALHDYATELSIATINFWIVADPDLVFDEYSCAMWSSIPDEFLQLYRELGGMVTDPLGPRIVRAATPMFFDPELYRREVDARPFRSRAIAMAAFDMNLHRVLFISMRDGATGAATGLVFSFDLATHLEFERLVASSCEELVRTTAIFWDYVQRGKWLADAIGLSPRELQALVLIARGFSLAQSAEHMSVSLRAAEKFLAGVRAKVGAKTNAQAVYRAMVYRALA